MILTVQNKLDAKQPCTYVSMQDFNATKPIFNVQTFNVSDSFVSSQNEDTKVLLLNAVQNMGISGYSPSMLKDDNTAIAKSQKHLFDLMKYYEGDRYHYYEPITTPYKDKYGTYTCGFGELTKKSMTSQQAYEHLCKKLEQSASELKNLLNKRIGNGTYEALPNSIKEALIDLCYNKGLSKISSNSTLMSAIKSKDYSGIIKNSVYVYSGKSNATKKEDPGLWRRSLNRAILGMRDLRGEELNQAKQEIETIYARALACHKANNVSENELQKVYEQYKYGKISSEPKSAESGKMIVDASFKGKGLYSVAQHAYKLLGNTDIDFGDFYKEFKKINREPETVEIGQELNIPYMKAGQTFNNVQTNAANEVKNTSTTDKSKKSEKPKSKPESPQKPGFWAKLWGGVKNFFGAIGRFFKNILPRKKETVVAAEEEKTKFEKMLENASIKQVGDLQIISQEYTIKKGDNLWNLAREFDTSEEIICNDNRIEDKNKINEGQKIKIQKLGYKVKQGDNLFQISKKFGLTIEILKDLNNIEDADKINNGQMIEIPGFVYEVEEGDTLTQISNKVGVSLEDLKNINGLTSDMIKPGQKIIIVYNNSDYAVSTDKTNVVVDNATNIKTEIIDMSSEAKLAKRPLLQKKRKINGKVVATRAVFQPTAQGKLSGKIIIVNAGHGYSQSGTDIGTPGLNGMDDEWLLNYDNAMRLKDKLCAQGAKVIFLQGKRRLIEDEISKPSNKADMFISVHVNSAAGTKDRTQFYYRDGGVKGAPRKNSIKLANIMEKNFDKWIPKHETIANKDKFIFQNKQDYAQSSVNDSRTGLLRAPLNVQKIPGVIWEVAFMSTAKGRERLSNPSLISNYADVMTQSVIEYFN